MVEFLLCWGADINALNNDGDTPLNILSSSPQIPQDGIFLNGIDPQEARGETFHALRIRKADAAIINKFGFNPLHVAASNGDLFAVKQLVYTFKLKDEVSSKGATALVYAIMNEHSECAKFLINAGANLYLQFYERIRPIDLLYSSKNEEMKVLFKTVTAKNNS
jgi:ankyrin repeat protein